MKNVKIAKRTEQVAIKKDIVCLVEYKMHGERNGIDMEWWLIYLLAIVWIVPAYQLGRVMAFRKTLKEMEKYD